MGQVVAVVIFLAGVVLGSVVGWRFIAAAKAAERGAAAEIEKELRSNIKAAAERESQMQSRLTEAAAARAAAETRASENEKKLAEERALLDEARTKLTAEFKALAGDILEEKSQRFAEQNRQSLGDLLQPFDKSLREFKSKVEDIYVSDVRERSSLKTELQQLRDLNQQLSSDASNLTRALKGSVKTQGAWGEMILERVLEAAGLRKGEEYEAQTRYENQEGRTGQPDVVIHLPENRNLVVDSKVTLNAYEDYANAEAEQARADALKRHLQSVKNHIGGLSKRNYQSLYELPSLDFVVMFVPVEPAYAAAIGNEPELWHDAWQKNVLLVGPSSLLFVVRTVAYLWRQEQQVRNVREIVDRGASLYDKFKLFIDDLESIGDRLRKAQEAYDDAFKKLSSGQGNLVRQAEMLVALGVKPSKRLPKGLTEQAGQLEISELPEALPEGKRNAAGA